MPTYLYFPEMNHRDYQVADKWNLDRQVTHNNFQRLEVRASSHTTANKATRAGALADLQAGDTVYVVMHGTAEGQSATNLLDNGTPCTYTPRALARSLEREGLPHEPIRLKMWICGSGVGENSFAAQFKLAMTDIGYPNMPVFGYNAQVVSSAYVTTSDEGSRQLPQPHKSAWNDGEDFPYVRASLRRIEF